MRLSGGAICHDNRADKATQKGDMMRWQLMWAAIAGLILVALSGAAYADKDKRGIASGRTDGRLTAKDFAVVVCNKSSYQVAVAAYYIPLGETDFYSQGWWIVGSGRCSTILRTANIHFALFGEEHNKGGGTYWGGNYGQCVEHPGPFKFRDNGTSRCAPGQDVVKFDKLTYSGPMGGTYTWTLSN